MRANSYTDIVARMKDKIIRGDLPVGQRIPTRVELERQFGATPMTINRAMRVLAEEGFIQARRGSVTIVAPHPPHLTDFALVFAFPPGIAPTHFFTAIREEAAKLQSPERRISFFYNVEEHTDVEDYRRLLALVEARRLAGILFANNPSVLQAIGSPLAVQSGLPRVTIMAGSGKTGIPEVCPNGDGFSQKALDYLAGLGRKRLAWITSVTVGWPEDRVEHIRREAHNRGMTVHPYWIQGAPLGAPPAAAQLAHVLLANQAERPDALVIDDDNLVEHATEGVAASGVRVPEDLTIVAHANFPHPTISLAPATRLGYDIGKMMQLCMERLEQQRRGLRPPPLTTLPPVFEQELKTILPA